MPKTTQTQAPRPLIAPLGWLVLVPLFWLGLGKKFPFSLIGENGHLIGSVFWATVTVGCFYFLTRPGTESFLARRKNLLLTSLWLCAPAFTAALDLIQWKHFSSFGYTFPAFLLLLDLTVFFLLLLKPNTRRAEVAIAIYAAHRFGSIFSFPLHPGRSDMFAAIIQAGTRWWEGGLAYAPSTETGIGRMPYFPLNWLAYLPAALLKFDPRWIGTVFTCCAGFLVLKGPLRDERPSALSVQLLSLFFISPYLAFRHELYLDPLFLALALMAWAASKKSAKLSALTCGIALATAHWAWVLGPFLLLRSVRPKNWSGLLMTGFFSLLVGGGILVCFIAPDPKAFFESVFLHQNWVGGPYRGELAFGISPLAYLVGLQTWLQPIQAVGLALTGIWALRRFGKGFADARTSLHCSGRVYRSESISRKLLLPNSVLHGGE